MTKEALERGIELQRAIDDLWKRKEKLESMAAICCENMDIAKSKTHNFSLEASKKDGGRDEFITLSANAAYSAIYEDIKKAEAELEKLDKEFEDL